MDFLAQRGFDVWCFDCEGYGRSDRARDSKFFIVDGADDASAVAATFRSAAGTQDFSCLVFHPARCGPRCSPKDALKSSSG